MAESFLTGSNRTWLNDIPTCFPANPNRAGGDGGGFAGRRTSRSVRSFMAQHGADRAEEDHDVSHDRPVLHVGHIKGLAFLGGQIGAAGHLPRAGDAWLDQHTGGIQLVVPLILLRQRRARTYHGHITHPHIEELRQLVDGEPTDEMPDLGDARIVLHLEDETIGLPGLLGELLLQRVGIDHHRTELDHLECLAAQTDAGLPVEHRTTVGELDGDGHRDGDDQRTDDRQGGDHQIEHALDQTTARRVLGHTLRDDRRALDGTDMNLMVRGVGGRGGHGHLQTKRLHARGEDVVVVRVSTQLVGHHHGLRVHADDAPAEAVIVIFEHRQRPAPVVVDLPPHRLVVAIRFDQVGLRIEPDRTHRHRTVVQLLTAGQELQHTSDAVRRPHDHRAVGIFAFAAVPHDERAADDTFRHGEQQSGQHHQACRCKRYLEVEQVIERTLDGPAHDRALHQQCVDLIPVAHDMPMIDADGTQRPDPEARKDDQVRDGAEVESEPERVQLLGLMPQVQHRGAGDHEHRRIAQRQREIEAEPPMQRWENCPPRATPASRSSVPSADAARSSIRADDAPFPAMLSSCDTN